MQDFLRGLLENWNQAVAAPDEGPDLRDRVCRWEDDLFGYFPIGHGFIEPAMAERLVGEVFDAAGRPVPEFELIDRFADPTIGGYADVKRHRITIERGALHRFLVLHECAHLLAPQDRRHGPTFIYIVQGLYRRAFDIPEKLVRQLLQRHALPQATAIR